FQAMPEFKVPALPSSGQPVQLVMSQNIEVGNRVNVQAASHKMEIDFEMPSSSRSIPADPFTIGGYTAAQYAGLELVNDLNLQCPICRRLLVDPITTICNHTVCTRCFNLSSIDNHPEPCPVCGKQFGPCSIWFFNQLNYDQACADIHKNRMALIDSFFATPMVRGRYDCASQLLEVRNPMEVYDLFRDIFWYYKNPENDQMVLRTYTHTFLRLMAVRLKKRINEQIKRVFQLEVELGHVIRMNNDSDAALMAKFLDDFPDRAEHSRKLFSDPDAVAEEDNAQLRCTIFPDAYPEKMVLAHLPCKREPAAVVCTVPESLPINHGDVEVTSSAPDGCAPEPHVFFVRSSAAADAQRDDEMVDEPSSSSAPPSSTSVTSPPPLTLNRFFKRPLRKKNDDKMDDMDVDNDPPSEGGSAAPTITASYSCGGALYNYAKPSNCPKVMESHACLHKECCNCALGVGVQQYYSVLEGPIRENDGAFPCSLNAPVSAGESRGNKRRDDPIWDPNWNSTVALSNHSYPMLTTEFLQDRMTGLIEKQEEETLLIYERLRDGMLRGHIEQAGEAAYATGPGQDTFVATGSFLESASRFLRLEKITEFPYKYGHCVSTLDFDTSGSLLAMGGSAKCVRVFDFEDQVKEYEKYSLLTGTNALLEIPMASKVSSLAWSRGDPQLMVITEYDGLSTLFDVHSMSEVRRHKDHNRRIWDVAFSHDCTRKFATCGDDGKVLMYSTTADASTSFINVGYSVTSIEFSPTDEHHIAMAVSDSTVYIYDLRFPRSAVVQLRGHKRAVSYVRYMRGAGAGSKGRLLSAAIDSTVREWDVGTARCERVFRGHTNEKNFTGLTTNGGDHFVTGSEGNDMYMFHTAFASPMVKKNFLESADVSELDEQHDRNDFVSCLKWKTGSNIFVAGNNQGMIQAYKAS
ncbi:hypothetical protein PFISCL1PPCAC_22857, partial [Pristionchus fissidentatus]